MQLNVRKENLLFLIVAELYVQKRKFLFIIVALQLKKKSYKSKTVGQVTHLLLSLITLPLIAAVHVAPLLKSPSLQVT